MVFEVMTAHLLRSAIPSRYRPIGYLEHLVRKRTGGRVFGGPFAQMQYIEGSVGSAYIPKLLGIYERELHRCVTEISALQLPLIIDIGAAEGYYAVGLARSNPQAQVVAFEMEERGRVLLQEMAAINGVSDRIDIRAKCEVEDLRQVLSNAPPSLIVCDVEGYEDVLLRPDQVPALQRAHLLVEMHDFILPGITETITERFATTHHVERVWQEPRHRSDFPFRSLGTALLPGGYIDWAVGEWRPVRMSWLQMTPKEK